MVVVMATIPVVATMMEEDIKEDTTKVTVQVATTIVASITIRTVAEEEEEVIRVTIDATTIATTVETVAAATTGRVATIRIVRETVTTAVLVAITSAVVATNDRVETTTAGMTTADATILTATVEMTDTDREQVPIVVARTLRAVAPEMEPTTTVVVAIEADRETTIGWVTKVQARDRNDHQGGRGARAALHHPGPRGAAPGVAVVHPEEVLIAAARTESQRSSETRIRHF